MDALDTVVGVAFLLLLRILPRRLNQTGALKTVLDSSIHSLEALGRALPVASLFL